MTTAPARRATPLRSMTMLLPVLEDSAGRAEWLTPRGTGYGKGRRRGKTNPFHCNRGHPPFPQQSSARIPRGGRRGFFTPKGLYDTAVDRAAHPRPRTPRVLLSTPKGSY